MRSLLLLATGLVSVLAQDLRQYIDIIQDVPSDPDPYVRCAKPVEGQGNWHLHTNATRAKQGAAVVGVGEFEEARLYYIGGREDNGRRIAPARLPYVEYLHVSANKWVEAASMGTDREALAAVVVSPAGDAGRSVKNARIYAIGGYSDSDSVLRSVEILTPGDEAWAPGPPMRLPRYGHAAAVWSPPARSLLNASFAHLLPAEYDEVTHVVFALGGDSGALNGHERSVEWLWLKATGAPVEWPAVSGALPVDRKPAVPPPSAGEPVTWNFAPSQMRFARFGTAAVVYRDKLFAVTGEEDASGRAEWCDLLRLCAEWTMTDAMRIPRAWSAVTWFPPLGGIVVAGGYRATVGTGPRFVQPTEVFFPDGSPPGANTSSWSPALWTGGLERSNWAFYPHSRFARYDYGMAALRVHGPSGMEDYRMYAVGGFNASSGRTSCTEEFSCYHSQWEQLAPAAGLRAHRAPLAIAAAALLWALA